ncbi:TPA: hypothetical protein ACS614_001526 [Klebsiella aerogenes]
MKQEQVSFKFQYRLCLFLSLELSGFFFVKNVMEAIKAGTEKLHRLALVDWNGKLPGNFFIIMFSMRTL